MTNFCIGNLNTHPITPLMSEMAKVTNLRRFTRTPNNYLAVPGWISVPTGKSTMELLLIPAAIASGCRRPLLRWWKIARPCTVMVSANGPRFVRSAAGLLSSLLTSNVLQYSYWKQWQQTCFVGRIVWVQMWPEVVFHASRNKLYTLGPTKGVGTNLEGEGLGKVHMRMRPLRKCMCVQLEQDVGCKKAVCGHSTPPPANSPDNLSMDAAWRKWISVDLQVL